MFKKIFISLLNMIFITFLATFLQIYLFKYTYTHIDFLPNKFQPFIDFVLSNFQFIFTIFDFITILILILFFLPFRKKPLERRNFKKIKLSIIPMLFILALGLASITSDFLTVIHYIIPNHDNYNSIPITSIWAIISLIIIAPICEEIIFRGFLFSILKKNLPINIALIFQAICFGIFHRNFIQGMYAFIGGLILGLVYYYTENIISNILVHIFLNFISFSVGFISSNSIVILFLLSGPLIFLLLYKYYSKFKNLLLNS